MFDAAQARLVAAGVYTVDGDINDRALLASLFAMCSFSHVLHLAAQVCWHLPAARPSAGYMRKLQ